MKISELFNVDGKVALITGGASGIGRACAEVLAENGASVVILDRDRPKLAETIATLARVSNSVAAEEADVTDLAAMQGAVANVAARFGGLDIAFINAGIGGGPGFLNMEGERNPAGAIENLADDFWYNHIRGNLTSVFVSLQAIVPAMRRRRSGSIVITTSVAALKTENFVCTPYLVAKAGATHLMHQVALELASENIRVNAMAPGSFVTGIGNGRMAEPEVQRRFAAANPMGRMAQPDEIKGLALYLASPASSYVTGAQFAIDGGGSLGLAD
jgi:NAD(P)-dependent dehydrogenase (short-subunit alcohol dehydrogenase family)